jgi:signal transduction histidine kinase
MPREEAKKRHPLMVEGHLTSIIYDSKAGLWRGVIRDASDGCYFLIQGPRSLNLKFGDKVRLQGQSDPGLYAPCILGQSITVLSPTGGMPDPIAVGFAELDSGLLDCGWVSVSGVVRGVEPLADVSPATQQLTVSVEGRTLRVLAFTAADLAQLEDSAVTLKGTVNYVFGKQGEQYVPMLWVAAEEHISIQQPRAKEGPRVTAVRELFTWDHQRDWSHAVSISGVVTAQFHPKRFYLTKDGVGLLVSLKETTELLPGSQVTVHGYPQRGPGQRELVEATLQMRSEGSPPSAQGVSDMPTLVANAGNLVMLRGVVETVEATSDSLAFVLVTAKPSIRVRTALSWRPGVAGLEEVIPGAEVEVTGISHVEFTDMREYVTRRAPSHLAVEMRSQADLRVIQQGPWWLSRRLPWWFSTGGGLLALAMAGMWLGQRRKMASARAVQERIDAVTQERHRISREVHDSLAQSLTAISMQLETARAAFDLDPQRAKPHVLLAREAASLALNDARQAVWSMHSQALEESPLPEAIRRVAEQLTVPGGAAIQGQTLGNWAPLPPLIEHALLRASQEALTNAIRHAKASSITWFLMYRAGSVRLEVGDNGQGLPDSIAAPSQRGGFGLLGLRERITALGGELSLSSEPGQGTRLSVAFDLQPPSSAT